RSRQRGRPRGARARRPRRAPRPRHAARAPEPPQTGPPTRTPPGRATSPDPAAQTHWVPFAATITANQPRKPAPHKPPGPTRGSFTATGKATGTQNETEHSHWVPLAAAITAPAPHTGASGPDLRDPRGGVTRSARAAKRARLPLPVARDERAGVEVAVRVRGAQQAHHEVHPRRREVLLHPRGVVGAHPVVVRERAAGVDERLLDRGLHHVVLAQALLVVGFLPVNICGAEGEGEVQARPGVVGVREVAHDEALHAHLVEGGVRGLHRGEVHLAEPVPRGGGLRHVAHRAPVEEEVPDVGGVELLLVVQRPRSLAEPDPTVL